MIEFKVDEKNKIIIAKLTGCSCDIVTEMEKRNSANRHGSTISIWCENAYLNDVYIGKCRFEKDEPFDIELGKTIAKKRCLEKYYIAKDKMYARILDELQETRKEIFHRYKK